MEKAWPTGFWPDACHLAAPGADSRSTTTAASGITRGMSDWGHDSCGATPGDKTEAAS